MKSSFLLALKTPSRLHRARAEAGSAKGLLFDPTAMPVTFGNRLVFGYLTRDKAMQVSPFVLEVLGRGLLLETTGSVVLAEDEAAAREVGIIKLHKPRGEKDRAG